MTICDMPQRTPEWFRARLGRVTGSRAGDVLAKIKTGEAAARRDYRIELVCERLTGVCAEHEFVSKDMLRGIEREPDAFAAYESLTGHVVRRTGFIQHDEWMAGCSLDGDVDDCTGIIELKVPKTATHLRYLRAGVLPAEHAAQVRHNLWVTGAAWADFVSFDDRLPSHLQVFCVRVTREQMALPAYEAEVLAFLADVDLEEAALRGWSALKEAV